VNRQAAIHFIEQYRDGVIDEAGAAELAATIRGGGPDADWILDELALSGWIRQALENVDEQSFVRSFLERLYAERSGELFTRTFNHRVNEANRTRKVPAARPGTRKLPWFSLMLARSRQVLIGRDAAATRRAGTFAWRRTLMIVSAAVTALALAAVWRALRTAGPAATVLDCSRGAAVEQDGRSLPLAKGDSLRPRATVVAPADGYVFLRNPRIDRLELRAGGRLRLSPEPAAGAGIAPAAPAALALDAGELRIVDIEADDGPPYVVVTPQARAEAALPLRCIITVSGAGTRVEVAEGRVVLTRHHDGRTIAVRKGHYAVIAEGAMLEARER